MNITITAMGFTLFKTILSGTRETNISATVIKTISASEGMLLHKKIEIISAKVKTIFILASIL